MAKGRSEPKGKSRILVVDDNIDTVKGMEILLRLSGHDVRTAQSGPQALEQARLHLPHFILLDIGLPGMNGYEVAKQLRAEEWGKNALIVAVSGYGQEEDRQRTKAAGFDYHLVKPISYDELHTLLRPTSESFT
jgi:CheY-like chemotaxis protein